MLHAANARDRMSNGRLLPPGVDGRSTLGRRANYLMRSYTAELGRDPTESDLANIRRRVALQLREEQLQERILRGEDVNPDTLTRLSSEQRRAEERSKPGKDGPAAPSLHDLLAEISEESAE